MLSIKTSTGEFTEVSLGHSFTYRETDNWWAIANGLHYEIDVLDGVRFAKILKTVAHVAVDESEGGTPVLETWKIKQHRVYAS